MLYVFNISLTAAMEGGVYFSGSDERRDGSRKALAFEYRTRNND